MADEGVLLCDIVQFSEGNKGSLAMVWSKAELIPYDVNLFVSNGRAWVVFDRCSRC